MDLLIIPDGNRRWARERGRGFDFGYRQLPVKIAMVVDTLKEEGISRLHFWCCSANNVSRPPEQVDSFLSHYADILEHVSEPGSLRVHIRGNRGLFPGDFAMVFSELEERTRWNGGFDLYYFLNYSSTDDLERAMKKTGTRDMKAVLSAMDEPDNIDVILRTGGNRRLSGFSPLKSPSAEVVAVPEYFPDLTPERIREMVEIYKRLEIRNGL